MFDFGWHIFLFLGNLVKATSILHKAQALNAKPAELLDTAMRNLRAGEKQLFPPAEEDPTTGNGVVRFVAQCCCFVRFVP